jgi:hypothetical protein
LLEISSLFVHIQIGFSFNPKRIQVNISGNFLKIMIGIDEKRLVAALVEMTRFLVTTIIIGGVRDIEVTHKFLKIS